MILYRVGKIGINNSYLLYKVSELYVYFRRIYAIVGIVGMPAIGIPTGYRRYRRALENLNSPPPTIGRRWAPPRCPWTGNVAV